MDSAKSRPFRRRKMLCDCHEQPITQVEGIDIRKRKMSLSLRVTRSTWLLQARLLDRRRLLAQDQPDLEALLLLRTSSDRFRCFAESGGQHPRNTILVAEKSRSIEAAFQFQDSWMRDLRKLSLGFAVITDLRR